MNKYIILNLFFFSTTLLSAPSKILFGSCLHQDKPAPILKTINKEKADLFIFLGDNIYGDTKDMAILEKKYQRLGRNPDFIKLKKQTPIIAIWDDHDFGRNDGGADYPKKQQSKQLMLDFWNEPKDSERRLQSNGIYTSYLFGEDQKTVQIILPDLRWNRTPLKSVTKINYETKRKALKMGPYLPDTNKDASMLGEKQWKWLEAELKKPATIKIIASSLQLLPEFSGWESWANYPNDRNRLLNFITENEIEGVVLISGDTHWGEISKLTEGLNYPLWEVTSSGLTEEWKDVSPNKHRIGKSIANVNYGEIIINWDDPVPSLSIGLKNVDGIIFNQTKITIHDLRAKVTTIKKKVD